MKCLLVYGTLSGSTMTAAELIGSTLRNSGYEVVVTPVEQTTRETISAYDAVIIGSPSWEDQGKDGQPLPEIRQFIESLRAADLSGKKTALFGLGDISYPHFCGAIDVMEGLLKNIQITPVIESLRVDRYYSVPDNEHKVTAWAEKFAGVLQQK